MRALQRAALIGSVGACPATLLLEYLGIGLDCLAEHLLKQQPATGLIEAPSALLPHRRSLAGQKMPSRLPGP